MIDKDGYRLNVGIILANKKGQLFWGKRTKSQGWQFPQGGVHPYETLEETMYRELYEEVGVTKKDVKIIATTKRWLRYELPTRMQRRVQKPLCIGQKQKWFLLQLDENNVEHIRFDTAKPEFDRWEWVSYWYPLNQVVAFKRNVYRRALFELSPQLPLKKELLLPKNVKIHSY